MPDDNFCQTSVNDTPDTPKWTVFQAAVMKLTPKSWSWLGQYSKEEQKFRYKRGWVSYNKDRIISIAKDNSIPADLLGCVAFNEAGGDPPWFKHHIVLMEKNYNPFSNGTLKTSEGAVKMQLGIALSIMGYPENRKLSYDEAKELTDCLERDVFNLTLVAKHLHQLILFDYPGIDTRILTDEQFAMAGCRYNRGIQRSLKDLLKSYYEPVGSKEPDRDYSSYGRACLEHRAEVRQLLHL